MLDTSGYVVQSLHMTTNTKEKTTAEYATEALKLLAAMTPEQKKFCAREIGKGFNDEMKRVNRRP